MGSLRIGMVAPEFPPELGGMAELARCLATALAAQDEIIVFCDPENGGLPDMPFAQRPVLGQTPADRHRLESAEVDVWLAMNAGMLPLLEGLGAPLFAYLHGNDFLEPWIPCGPSWLERLQRPYLGRLRHALRRRAIRRAMPAVRQVLANSRRTAELIAARLGVAAARITVCPPGVDDDFFQIPVAAPAGPLRLLTVSRLTRHTARKNVDGVLRAVHHLAPRLPLCYTVVGDGDDRPRLEALAEELGIAEQVRFRGAVSRADLLAAYAESDLFVLAARATARDVEGFGLVYLEASAAGVPVICSRGGGAVDAVADGVNGILIPDSSSAAIAAGIERFARQRASFPPQQVRAIAARFRWPEAAARVRDALLSG